MDSELAASDADQFASEAFLFHHDAVEWERPVAAWRREYEEGSLLEQWRLTMQWQIEQLRRSQQDVAALLTTEATLVAAISNLRVQRAVQWLTVVILILTGAAAVFAGLALQASGK